MNVKSIIFATFLLTHVSPLYGQMPLEVAFPNLSFVRPVDLQEPGDGTDRLFVVEQRGIIWVFENDPSTSQKKSFLDIRARVNDGGNEEGLLGLAFHPAYEDSGYFYVNYTAANPRRTVVARYSVSSGDPDLAVFSSEAVVLEVNQPFANHNGGQVAFGPDGFLYIGMGDGGSGGDPLGHGQNLTTLLGALLRIDVDTTTVSTNYGIPEGNPFFDNSQGYREEIYAYGLRNPWRFSIDTVTGRIWLADVGQNTYEEVDVIEKAGNYGWNIMEGFHCFSPPSGCNTQGLTLPRWEYDHSVGRSITGGYVYRGARLPELVGKYIYADYVTGIIWSLEYDGVNPPVNSELNDTALFIASFGTDKNNELYICAFDGKIYQFEASGVPTGLQGFRSYWTGGHVEVSWRLIDVASLVTFEVYRARGTEGPFVPFEDPEITRRSDEFILADHDSERGTTYRYRVVILENGEAVASFETRLTTPAERIALEPNYPNPFNPTTRIEFSVPEKDRVNLSVYDVSGRHVRTLLDQTMRPDTYTEEWDGRDDHGNSLASGTYFYRLKVGNQTLTRKAVLLK
jgi:glucose/arabinose dehydrogenase